MANLSLIFGILGNIISLLVFSSPIATFRGVVRKKSTENYKGIPYITTLLCTSLWTFYGIIKPGGLLVATVNGAGAILQFVYVTLFLIYAPKDTKLQSIKLVGLLNIGFFGSIIIVTLCVIHGSLRLTLVGVLCAALTVGMYASPLSVMRIVVKTQSVEYMPFFLSFFLFLNAGIWSTYAVIVKDFYIGVPNGIGFLLGFAQLVLYSLYRNKSTVKEEEGSTHLVRDDIEMQLHEVDFDKEAKVKNRSLVKGRSLPKPSVAKQHSFEKILKTFSLTPLDLQSGWPDEDDIKLGHKPSALVP